LKSYRYNSPVLLSQIELNDGLCNKQFHWSIALTGHRKFYALPCLKLRQNIDLKWRELRQFPNYKHIWSEIKCFIKYSMVYYVIRTSNINTKILLSLMNNFNNKFLVSIPVGFKFLNVLVLKKLKNCSLDVKY
jgi:hypothetical protein